MLILEGDTEPTSLTFTADGTQLVAVSEGGGVAVWTLPEGELLRRVEATGPRDTEVAVHPSGRVAFVAAGPLLVVPLSEGDARTVGTGTGSVSQVRVSQNGERVVAAAASRGRPRLIVFRCNKRYELSLAWEAELGEHRELLGGFVGGDDRFVAVGHGQLVVRDAATGAVQSTMSYPSGYVRGWAVSPDGGRFAAMGWEKLYVWDTAKWGKPTRVAGHSSRPYSSFAFHPSKPLFIVVQRHQTLVKFFDTTTWKPIAKFQWKLGEMTAVAFSPDGTLAAAGSSDGKIVVWDVDA